MNNLRQALTLELARRDFFTYCNVMHPNFYKKDRKYLIDMCNQLQEFYFDDTKEFMIINAPPRHAKSFTATNFVEWVLGINPLERIMSASYSHDLSKTFSKKVRSTISTEKIGDNIVYSDIFEDTKIKFGSAEAMKWQTEQSSQINYLATSPSGTATGFGCSLMVIDDLVKNAYEANNEKILEGQFDWFCFEGETKVNTKKGYKKIKNIRIGDRILTYNHSKCIIEEKEVVRTNSKLSNIYRLEFENGKVIETTGNHKFYTNKGYKTVEEILYSMWGTLKEGETILFEEVYGESERRNNNATKGELFKLQQGNKHRKGKQTEKILFYRMQTRLQNKKFKVKIRNVEQDKRRSKREIQKVPKMWEHSKLTCPPHRPQFKKQRFIKYDGIMPIMPLKLSQATRLPQNEYKRVYDIEVKDNHNFFVDSILVHNCNTMLSRREGKKKVIVIMTRWSSKDLAGRLIEFLEDNKISYSHINYKAEQEGNKMLCDEIFNKATADRTRLLMGEDIYQANYNQEPIDSKGCLYSNLMEYAELPEVITSIENYTDTADRGKDFLCSINYAISKDGYAYILDVLYTQESMETTEIKVAEMFTRDNVNYAHIESNNGGRGFARNVDRLIKEMGNRHTKIKPFHQSKNKESRILTGSTGVMQNIYFPKDWKFKYPMFYKHVTGFQRAGVNEFDDSVDTLTGIYEKINRNKSRMKVGRL